jgi:starch phosphorylase
MFSTKEEFKQEYSKRFIETYGRSIEQSDPTERYMCLGELIRDQAAMDWMTTKNQIARHQQKQLFYFSMEFLIGRMLTNNLMNMGIYDIVKDGLADMGYDINELEESETDAALGNGGLGRLAACFMDSLATLGYAGHGNTIRYQYGLFKQKIEDDKQVEVPDIWLKTGFPWEVRKPKHAVDVKFFGEVETEWLPSGKMAVRHTNAETVRAVPYDVPMIGRGNHIVNTLRLWKPEASEDGPVDRDFITYIEDVNKICQNVYPDDSTDEGKLLRLKQEYFFVSAGCQTIVRSHLENYGTLDNLADKVVIQLNDTHPTLIIPELMRILLDEHEYEWDQAWDIVTHTVAYTNHTIMQEALEKWPQSTMEKLLPRIFVLIEEIDSRFRRKVMTEFGSLHLADRTAIISDGIVHMANLDAIAAFSINGVARIHTDILKNSVLKDFYRIYPDKFNNKTNGITHRRWLVYSNPQLTKLLTDTIGDSFIRHPDDLEKLVPYVDDPEVQQRFAQVKRERKQILADYIQKEMGIEVSPDAVFDVQAKRLHAYKRQMLNAMRLIHLYQYCKEHPGFTMVPHVYLFSAKAAPSYVYAKQVIELINKVADVVNNDPDVNSFLKVVFIPNYSVSIAEILLNAADISEQISTAGTEASGTSNMKLMMNGAVTLATMDGANVEIREAVGEENFMLFGNTVEQLDELREKGYNAMKIFKQDQEIHQVVNSLIDGTWSSDPDEFKTIYDELLYRNDPYFHLADYHSYCEAHARLDELVQDPARWRHMCLMNIARSGHFSSDRTIEEYNRDIWHLEPVKQDD